MYYTFETHLKDRGEKKKRFMRVGLPLPIVVAFKLCKVQVNLDSGNTRVVEMVLESRSREIELEDGASGDGGAGVGVELGAAAGGWRALYDYAATEGPPCPANPPTHTHTHSLAHTHTHSLTHTLSLTQPPPFCTY